MDSLTTTCCIVGGGPAGMMLGLLLARAGIETVVLEKHGDFLRDFRGDTIHPSTLQLMEELGFLDEFLQLPHQEVREIGAHFSDGFHHIADFSHLPTRCRFIAFMPQWDFLNFLAAHARRYPAFHLRLETEVIGLLEENGRCAGVRARTPHGEVEVRASLTFGADGRGSTVRAQASLEVEDLGAPIDVLWFRIPKAPGTPDKAFGYVGAGHFMVLIDRGEYWQCGFIIGKGQFPALQQSGLPAFRAEVCRLAPFLCEPIESITAWEQVRLLTVKVDRLRQWCRKGLLCLGDAAHAMSPVGGVGINLAIQDAVAAANLLVPALRAGNVTEAHLRSVQKRRAWPAHGTQRLQVFLHRRLLGPVLQAKGKVKAPWFFRLLQWFPLLRRLLARAVGLGLRPEHIAPV